MPISSAMRHRVHRPGAAEGDQREVARVVAALDRDLADRRGHARDGDLDDALGERLHAEPADAPGERRHGRRAPARDRG